jgi:hypothetical protein
MKRMIRWIALATLALSTSSCGIPQLLGRTAGNAVKTARDFANVAGAAL